MAYFDRGLLKVLGAIPSSFQSDNNIYIFIVPSNSSLGKSSTDYSNVKQRVLDKASGDIRSTEDGEVGIFSSSKLGQLVGGLRHIADARQVMTAEEIAAFQRKQFQALVQRKQSEVRLKSEQIQQVQEKRIEERQANDARAVVVQEKIDSVVDEKTTWKTIWKHVVQGEQNMSKADGQTWCEYFASLTGNHEAVDRSCPAALKAWDKDMEFEDMMILVASIWKKFQAETDRLEKSLRYVQRKQAEGKKDQLLQQLAKAKIDKMLDPESKEKDKMLVSKQVVVFQSGILLFMLFRC